MRPIRAVRYGILAAILIGGVVLLAVGSGAGATGAGVVLIGVAAIVFLVNVLARLAISSQEDRAREQRAREGFSGHGRGPGEIVNPDRPTLASPPIIRLASPASAR